jgi:deoxyribonuclease V
MTTVQFVAVQRRLSQQIVTEGEVTAPQFIAGVDIAAGRAGEEARAAVVVLSYPRLRLVEIGLARAGWRCPIYPVSLLPGLPLVLESCQKITLKPDLIMVDGQGIAHPRRLGIASHLGLLLDIPSVGCAKSRLCGECSLPAAEEGSYTHIIDKDEVIGAVLRTRSGVKPLYISAGHRISLDNALYW